MQHHNDDKYITQRESGRYEVKVPRGDGGREYVGLFETVEEARLGRDRAMGLASSINWHDDRHTITIATNGKGQHQHTNYVIPANVELITQPPLQISPTSWLYASDFHVPLHNREYIRRLLQVAQARQVEDLIIGGDFFDFDSSSTHPKSQQAGLNDTLEIGGDVLCTLAQVFKTIYILPGNHCLRVGKKLDEHLDFNKLVHAAVRGRIPANRLKVTNLDYIYIGPEETGWVVGHPRFFSTVPAKGGAEVAMIQRRNVVGAHNHIIGLMQSKCGRYWSIDPGHMTEPTLTPYKMQSNGLSRYPEWKPGFLLVENNIPRLCTDGLVNWEELGV